MPTAITAENWPTIRRNFRHGFATNLHVAIATVDAEGQPNVTPIGSFFLNRDGFSGFSLKFSPKTSLQMQEPTPRSASWR